jgi:hypothetical protein
MTPASMSNKPERRLSHKDLDKQLSKVQFKDEDSAKLFYHLSGQNWFVQYARGSNAAANKIIKKVKSGIEHKQYTDTNMAQLDDGWKRYYKPPKKSSAKKKLEKEQTKIVKEETKKSKKVNRKQREKVKAQERKAPSGRAYSNTEIHEGINSKRAKEWRKKNKIKESDK